MAFYEKQKRKQVTSGYKIKMSGLHHGLLGNNRDTSSTPQSSYTLDGRALQEYAD
jgi:hypothetical protein